MVPIDEPAGSIVAWLADASSEPFKQLISGVGELLGVVTAIVDRHGNVLFVSRRQRLCSEFHCLNEKTGARCLIGGIAMEQPVDIGCKAYRCPNGLSVLTAPIIIDSSHVANAYIGHVLTAQPDLEFFTRQAKEFCFDTQKYLEALAEVPVIDEEELSAISDCLSGLAALFSSKWHDFFQLQQSCSYFHSLIECSLDPMFTVDKEGKLTNVNEATIRITGVPRDELIGTECAIYATDPDKARAEYKQVFASGSLRNIPISVRHRDGTLTDVLINASVYRDEGGSIIGALGASRDITEQKQASRYARSLIECALDPLVTINPEGKITDANEAALNIRGVTRDELIGTDFAQYFTEPDKAREGYKKAFALGQVLECPLTICDKDGKLTDLVYNASVYRGVDGRLLGVFAAGHDVTERKLLESQIHTQTQRLEGRNRVYREALNCHTMEELGRTCLAVTEEITGSKFGYIGLLNSQGLLDAFAMSNPGWDACSVPAEEALLSLSNLPIRGIDRAALLDGKSRIINGAAVINAHPDHFAAPAGHPPLTTFLGVPLTEAGKTIGLIALANKDCGYTPLDQENVESLAVTIVEALQRKRVEEALLQARASQLRAEELEHLNEELMVARDQALVASRLKSEFVANVSHELRTPLTGILGMNELLLGSELGEYQKGCAQAVESCAKSLLSLVNDILDMSKIETGGIDMHSVPFNPLSLVDRSIAIIESSARSKNLQLIEEHDANASIILLGDPDRLQQVLVNLLANAVKFTSRGEIRLNTSIVPRGENLCTLKFSVSDTGIGIASEEEKFLFTPFSQVDGSMTRQYGGSGLGLAISKRLVELMGGEINWWSEKNKGSTFWFAVPLQRSGERSATPASELTVALSMSGTILVVEDNLLLQMMVAKQLEKLGFGCVTAGTAEECLQCLEESSYSLILMDCQLPQMDGFEATRQIRAREANTGTHIPIIAVTASAMDTDRDKCLAAEMDDYISKPYTTDQLRQKLNRWLPKSQVL